MAKPISTKKLIMLLSTLAATFVIFFAMSLSASAASYPAVKLDVPRISQRPNTGDCAIASMATVEAYCHKLPAGNYNSKAYQAVYSANGYSISAMWSKIGYKTIEGFDMKTAYNQLKTGYPIIVHRTSQHYSVIYAYDGNSSRLELSGFLIVDVDDSYNNKTPTMRLNSWISGSRGSLDRMVIRENGLAIATDKVKITTNHPASDMAKGEAFTPYGMIVSDVKITTVTVTVNTAAGAQKQIYSATPNTTSFALSKASGKIKIASLPVGTYSYNVYAKDASGDSATYKFNFTVGGGGTTTPVVQIKEVNYEAIVNADPCLNMRTGAGLDYAVIDTIPDGTKIKVTGECDGWARVTYGSKIGWVSMSYIEKCAAQTPIAPTPTPTPPETFTSYYARLTDAGNLKESASVFSTTLTTVPKNTVVKVIGESNGWIKFAYNGEVGWAKESDCILNVGDLDGNGNVNSNDALSILKSSTGSSQLTDEQKNSADFNGDGQVNSLDALVVLKVAAGITKFD